MSYTPNTWQNGDIISAEKLNNMEQGIANAGSEIPTIVFTYDQTGNYYTCSWTVQELTALITAQDFSFTIVKVIVVDEGDELINYFIPSRSARDTLTCGAYGNFIINIGQTPTLTVLMQSGPTNYVYNSSTNHWEVNSEEELS